MNTQNLLFSIAGFFFLLCCFRFYQMFESIVEKLVSVREKLGNLEQTSFTRQQQFNDQIINQNQESKKHMHNNWQETHQMLDKIREKLQMVNQANEQMIGLSTEMSALTNILDNKQRRGLFGEQCLERMVKDSLPEKHVHMQYTLANNFRVDCLITLPENTGALAIDAKFPLESYRKMCQSPDDIIHVRQFKNDLKKHIADVARKYISPPETIASAILFIPSESIFSEVNCVHQDLVEIAHRQKVWLVSPNTLMACMTTIANLIKNSQTEQHLEDITQNLKALEDDFIRFDKRINDFSKSFVSAGNHLELIQKSSQKIIKRFNAIDQVIVKSEVEEMVD